MKNLRVLFVTSASDDYLSAVLWDGLHDLLGPEALIADAANAYMLHRPRDWQGPVPDSCKEVGWQARPTAVLEDGDGDFDLLIVNHAVRRDHDWDWVDRLRRERLAPGAQVVFINGGDSEQWGETPPFHTDAAFRREMAPGFPYPGHTQSLLMAAPARWFEWTEVTHRYIAILHAGYCNPTDGLRVRWLAAQKIFQTKKWHHSLVATAGLLHYPLYRSYYLRHTELAICPGGGGEGVVGSDAMKTWEAISVGAIPVLVAHPPRVREPWFADDEIFQCATVEELPDLLDHALTEVDLPAMRRRLLDRARREHTTRARAENVLRAVGLWPREGR